MLPQRGSQGAIDAKGIKLLSSLQIPQQVSKDSGLYPAQKGMFCLVSLGYSSFKFRLSFSHCRKGHETQSCKAVAGELGSLSPKPRGGRRSAQHSVCSPAALLLPHSASASHPGQLLVLQLPELGARLSFPAAKFLAGTKGNPESFVLT